MDNELARYIVSHFSHLATDKENFAIRHLGLLYKIEHSENKESTERKIAMYKSKGWLSEDKEVLEMVSGGQEKLDKYIAERILSAHSDKVLINNCPNCGRLARTPSAKQCRHCGHSWR
jgi:hypothetical protein